ncbi:hypothetical protein FKW77_001086 [Venturia effusa]|uniref:Cellobiose dehydrogenase-like cytochrome domain-containing protein n=1 Tax=Venturia effusa TaxID=50376 RepID=A0A517LI16_9PEZI|nr:hypothetical protein FKW77_001086 [Venturia effusa]
MKSLFNVLSLCGVALAQTVAYTDPATKITFQSWTDPKSGVRVSVALPQNATTDLIAQIQAPLKGGIGWAGIALGPVMVYSPLIAVWSHANKTQTTVRRTEKYMPPPVYKSDIVLKTIAAGTSVNATHLTYTFLCAKCSFSGVRMGWAMSTDPVPTPEDADGSMLGFHKAGFGGFTVDVEKAQNAGFAGWATTAA